MAATPEGRTRSQTRTSQDVVLLKQLVFICVLIYSIIVCFFFHPKEPILYGRNIYFISVCALWPLKPLLHIVIQVSELCCVDRAWLGCVGLCGVDKAWLGCVVLGCVELCWEPLTDDGCGLDGLHHLLQCLHVRVLLSKLFLFVVQVATTLRIKRH